MTREEIITEVGRYFTIDELACNHILTRWAGRSWQFLDTDYLHTLLVIRRDILQRPMYCNDHNNGTHQRGCAAICATWFDRKPTRIYHRTFSVKRVISPFRA